MDRGDILTAGLVALWVNDQANRRADDLPARIAAQARSQGEADVLRRGVAAYQAMTELGEVTPDLLAQVREAEAVLRAQQERLEDKRLYAAAEAGFRRDSKLARKRMGWFKATVGWGLLWLPSMWFGAELFDGEHAAQWFAATPPSLWVAYRLYRNGKIKSQLNNRSRPTPSPRRGHLPEAEPSQVPAWARDIKF